MFTFLFDGFLRRVFSLLRAGGIYISIVLWLEGIGSSSCPRFFPLSSPGVLAQDSPHLFTVASLFETLLHPEFGMRLRSPRPLFQNWFSYSLFPLTERRCHFRFWVLANHFASIFFLPLSGDFFGLLYVQYLPSLSIRSQSANICWLSLWPTFFTFGRKGLT